MSFVKKYLHSAFMLMVLYIFGSLFLSLGTAAARFAYAYLNHLSPRIFPLFNVITEKEAYGKYLAFLSAAGIFISIYLMHYFALRMDNSKFELMIDKTDGQYTLKEGLVIFLREFGISELIICAALPVILIFPSYLIPDFGFIEVPVLAFLVGVLEKVLWLGYAFKEHYSLPLALCLSVVFSLIARASVLPGALSKWRASWLSGSVE